ncbi:MAG TPA: phosphopantetheine-binding protein [Chthoniobacterales bacterium]|nr:phosphopantetheine-binding protein [Chthoniobacterales bacterium]
MNAKDEIRNFLQEHVRSCKLEDSQDIFAEGLVSSMFVMQLVVMVEQKFGISVEGADLNRDHFRSIEAMAAFVTRKQSR